MTMIAPNKSRVLVTGPELDVLVGGCDVVSCRVVCGNCRPSLAVPVHDVHGSVPDGQIVDEPADDAARLRRLDRRCAAVVAVTVIVGAGYTAGRAIGPDEHLVPDALVWALAGLLFAAGVVLLAVALLLRWRDARRPAGTELLGEVCDGR